MNTFSPITDEICAIIYKLRKKTVRLPFRLQNQERYILEAVIYEDYISLVKDKVVKA